MLYTFRYTFVADHYQYVACIGPIALAAAGIAMSFDILAKRKPLLKPVFCGALLLTLGILTWRQCRMYTDAETLWRTTIKRNPACWMAYDNLGNVLLQKGQVVEAIVQFQQALAIKPDDAEAYNNLGDALVQKGRIDEAIVQLQQALAIKPDFAEAHYNLGNALFRKGQTNEAIAQFEIAIGIKPDYVEALSNLGTTLAQNGQVDEAVIQFQKALAIRPGLVEAQNGLANIAWVLSTSADPTVQNGTKAVELAQQIDRLSGGRNPAMATTLAAAYAEAGRFPEAITTAQRALQLATSQNNGELVVALKAQLKLYQAGFPLRQTSPSR